MVGKVFKSFSDADNVGVGADAVKAENTDAVVRVEAAKLGSSLGNMGMGAGGRPLVVTPQAPLEFVPEVD